MRDLLNKIKEYTALLTGLLILLGYSFYHFYYYHFDIEFYFYVTSGEIVFSFLSVIIPLIIFVSVLLLPIIISENKEDSTMASVLDFIQKIQNI